MAAIQFSVAVRNAALAAIESTIGTSPKLRIFTDSRPANCAAASVGTLLCEIALPSDWLAAPSDGSVSKSGTWSGTTIAAGTAGYYRIFDTAGTTCHEQGSITQAITLLTTAATSAGNNVITVADTTGIAAGQGVSGAGVPSGATVLSTTGTTVVMSTASVAGISSGGAVTFGDTSGNLQLTNTTFSSGQGIVIDAKTIICPGA
jgi:hypothetical protein